MLGGNERGVIIKCGSPMLSGLLSINLMTAGVFEENSHKDAKRGEITANFHHAWIKAHPRVSYIRKRR